VVGVPNGFYGTITFQWTFQFMGIMQVSTPGCPSDWTVTALTSLNGSIVIPQSDYVANPSPTPEPTSSATSTT
jgi:hypothetical protein